MVLRKCKWENNGKASACLFLSHKSIFVSYEVPAQCGFYTSGASPFPRASVQTLSSASSCHIGQRRALVSFPKRRPVHQAQGDAAFLAGPGSDGVMVTWKDNFDCFYSEVAELGRYGGKPAAPPEIAESETQLCRSPQRKFSGGLCQQLEVRCITSDV